MSKIQFDATITYWKQLLQLDSSMYYTSKLTTEDIVHELLHHKFPHLTEAQIHRETERWLTYSRKGVKKH